MQAGQELQGGRNYRAVFPGFYFCLIYPGLGARARNAKGADKKNAPREAALFSQNQYLPYLVKNKLQFHSTSVGCGEPGSPPLAGCKEVLGAPHSPHTWHGIREERGGRANPTPVVPPPAVVSVKKESSNKELPPHHSQ